MEIKNRHVLITGANRGIGLGIAKMCAQQGAKLHLVLRHPDDALKAQLITLGAQAVLVYTADLSQRESVTQLLTQLDKIPLDILINNAGLLTGGLIEGQPIDDIYAMFQVNLLSLIQLTRGILPGMVERKSGKIINNASVSAVMHLPCASTYAASKAAVMAFTNCIEAELKETGVSTLCLITPGIKTRMFDEIAVKYGKNLDVPQDFIGPDEYAQRIRKAIQDDESYLLPTGATAVGLAVSRYLPALFRWAVGRRFHR